MNTSDNLIQGHQLARNFTFSNYDKWNVNLSDFSIDWVIEQGYLTGGVSSADINISLQSLAESNTTTWDMALTINETNNMVELGMGLNSTFANYDTWNYNNSINLQAWALAQGWATSSIASADINISIADSRFDSTNVAFINDTQTFALDQSFDSGIIIDGITHTSIPINSTFANYDDWNLNESILMQLWVGEQGYITDAGWDMDYTNLAMINQSNTFALNQSLSKSLLVTNYLDVDSNTLFVNSAGNKVGIGTKNLGSSAQLEIDGGASAVEMYMEAGAGADAILTMIADQKDDNADYWQLKHEADDNDFEFNNYGTGSWLTRLIIQDTGNVGIGIDPPTSKLHVTGDGNFSGSISATQICLTGDTCETSWPEAGVDDMDYTNLAMINQTNVMAEEVNFTKNITMVGGMVMDATNMVGRYDWNGSCHIFYAVGGATYIC